MPTSTPSTKQTVTLVGTGENAAPAVTLSPTSLAFGNQNLTTTSGAQTVTLTNSGSAELTIASIAASGDFAETKTCGTSVAAGASCTIFPYGRNCNTRGHDRPASALTG